MNTTWMEEIGLVQRQPPRPDEIGLADPANLFTTSDRHPGYVATSSGRLFDVTDPKQDEIDIREIAHALSQINRFGGHTKFPYSVAQHLGLCAEECATRYPDRDDLAFACLMHDAAEAYVGDVIRPIKRLIGSVFRPLEDRVQAAIASRYGLPQGDEVSRVVHEIDNAVCLAESTALMVDAQSWKWGDTRSASVPIYPMSATSAQVYFLWQFNRLSNEEIFAC